LKALAGATTHPPQHGSASPPLSLLLQASADSSALAKAVSVSAKFHSPNSTDVIMNCCLPPSLMTLSANGSNVYSAAAKVAGVPCTSLPHSIICDNHAGMQLSELMVSVRSIAISFRQSRYRRIQRASDPFVLLADSPSCMLIQCAADRIPQLPQHMWNYSSSCCSSLQMMQLHPACQAVCSTSGCAKFAKLRQANGPRVSAIFLPPPGVQRCLLLHLNSVFLIRLCALLQAAGCFRQEITRACG
jgi:hypothetical protein